MNFIALFIYTTIAYVLSIILGPLVISYFQRLSVKQVVREDGLESHYVKTGTPTMGAFIFLVPAVLVTLIGAVIQDVLSVELLVVLASTVLFGAVGFIDDYRKVIKKHNEGLTAKEKIIAQCLIGIPLAIFVTMQSTTLWIPFTNIFWDLGIFKFVIAFVAVIATTNAVNLTDGVDGLSSSVTVLVLMFYTFVALRFDFIGFELFSSVLLASLLGFLLFNKYPAKIFMGDVGSLALGGAVVALAALTQTLLLIFIVGIIYFVETLSVTIQVLYFKKTQKRVFKMAPIHHHFELSGWSEKKIVRNFSLVTGVGIVLGVISLLWRI